MYNFMLPFVLVFAASTIGFVLVTELVVHTGLVPGGQPFLFRKRKNVE